jgi:phospholipid/cholesterol/gamma-HCH transport system substrate-binding protein
MDERIMQFRVGVMFLGTLLCIAILLVMFGRLPSITGKSYTINIDFDDAGGVTKDTPIRKSGILIGRVTQIQLVNNDSVVRITARIYADKKIYQNEQCYINRSQLVMGDTSLVFRVPDGGRPAGTVVQDNDTLQGRMSDDPTGLMGPMKTAIDTVRKTGDALSSAAEEMGAAAKKVGHILDKEEASIHLALENASKSLDSIAAILGDENTRNNLATAMKKLPETVDNMNGAFKTINQSVEEFSRPSPQDGKTPIQHMVSTIEMIEKMLKNFREGKPGELPPAQQIVGVIENVNDITRLMKSVVNRIDSGDGTIGALMKDRELYDRLNRTVRNANELTEKLKPILDDARVFSDKVARHPGSIIRDAVKPGPGLK